MDTSYKIAVVIAILLCVFVVAYFVSQDADPQRDPIDAVGPSRDEATADAQRQAADEAEVSGASDPAPDKFSRPPASALAGRQNPPERAAKPAEGPREGATTDAQRQAADEAEVSGASDPAPDKFSRPPASALADRQNPPGRAAKPAEGPRDEARHGGLQMPLAATGRARTPGPARGQGRVTDGSIVFGDANRRPGPSPAADPRLPDLADGIPTLTLDGKRRIDQQDRGDVGITRDRPATSSTPKIHTVQTADTFTSIAAARYGDASRWVDIAKANPLVDPQRLQLGQQLRLPARQARRPPAQPVPARPPDKNTYVVQAGDNLSTIAAHHYRDPNLWRVIYNANRAGIGDNPNRIRAGTRINIPPAPAE